MNNFIFENSSKVYFGEGCVKEYLSSILSAYGDTVMLCYGGGSIKKSGIYDIFARQAKRNLLSLQLMFGAFQKTAKQTKSLQKQVLRL